MGVRLNREYRIKFYLNARHFIIINGHKGAVHPHTWEMVLDIRFGRSSFVEFRTFEQGISGYLAKFQNQVMNDIAPFDTILPTLENIVDVFAEDFYTIIHDIGGVLTRIEASETPTHSYILNLSEHDENAKLSGETDQKIASDVMDAVLDEIVH